MRTTLIKTLHFWIGLLGVLVFILTGQYMDHEYNHLSDMSDGPRMLFRSGHIYFLLASVINLVLGVYWVRATSQVSRLIQILISVIVFLSPFLLIVGFFTEPHMHDLLRPYSRLGLYGIFAAAILLVLQSIFDHKV